MLIVTTSLCGNNPRPTINFRNGDKKNIVEAILRIIEYARKIPDNIDENKKKL